MLLRALVSLSAVTLSLASPLVPRQSGGANATSTATGTSGTSANATSTAGSASGPKVTLYPSTGDQQPVELTGTRYPTLGQDVYLGLPFAKPPVGDLRFTPPEAEVWNTTAFSARKQPPACLQDPSGSYGTYGYSEDCLYLNVFTPQGANGSTASLPVMVWIYGGSFTAGAASTYNASAIVGQSILSQKPTIVVALNYRLGIFGFGYGEEIAQNGAANLGIKDQLRALEWVQENIWAFGGDPSQVTVFGESAGAICISLMYLNPDISLFKSAIMESGAQSVAPIGPTASTWNTPYALLAQAANCSSSSNSSSSNSSSFDCLKAAPAQTVLKAQLAVKNTTLYSTAFVFAPSIDGDLIPDSPHTLIQNGQFAKIPFISGNNKDEGTVFAPKTVNNETFLAEAIYAVEPNGISNQTVLEILQLYPDVPALGSPFGTGNNTFGLAPEFKQLSAILGDATFQANRRWFLRYANVQNVPSWSYHFESVPPGNSTAYLGSYHGSEVYFVFGLVQVAPGYTDGQKLLSRQMIDYWINFAYYTDPSGTNTGPANATYWPAYGSDLNLLRLLEGNMTVIPDTYRSEQIEYFLSQPQAFNYKRGLPV